EHLFTLSGRLLRDAVADLGRWCKYGAVITDLCEATETADGGGGAECHQVAVVYLGGKAGRADLVEPDVLVEVEREPVRAYGPMERDEHLPLLGIPDALHSPNQAGALRHQELLVVVRVVVRRQHDKDGAGEAAVNVVGDDTLEYRTLEDPI